MTVVQFKQPLLQDIGSKVEVIGEDEPNLPAGTRRRRVWDDWDDE